LETLVVKIDFLVQPTIQLGRSITEFIELAPSPTKVIAVSAFARRQTLMRLRGAVLRIRRRGGEVRVVVGVDLDGTSEEALREILGWNVDARVVKNKKPRHTFHPKIYLIERPRNADILIGSSNLTEGGLYRNYECLAHIRYEFPQDREEYGSAVASLQLFLNPSGATVRLLTAELIEQLTRQGIIHAEREIERARRTAFVRRSRRAQREAFAFGSEIIADPPPLSPSLLSELVTSVERERQRRRRRAGTGQKIVLRSPVEISPTSFYMHLPKLQGANIPGEARVPLAARDVAEEFWGWPANYKKESGRTGRVYWNWKPTWRILDANNFAVSEFDQVRMYEYVESSDFRFYSSKLVQLGADKGDIVRIQRLAEPDAEFECVVAKRGTPAHAEFATYCTEQIRNSPGRRYGYA
jgi:phosphatidylserine/phosphatidylglycerophosphate/cardiolipin synthase-like enzyme